ncbi:hypothetical protein [Algibacter sp.]|uniref:hypothetical protein n=1 Tax=Algibacter sp. TaxID=1872428 RepID=UPI003C70FEC5
MKTMFKIKKVLILLTLALFCAYGCSSEEVLIPESDSSILLESSASKAAKKGKVIHHVSLGSNDACEAYGLPNGCDGNFSLVANMHADGSVKGQWQDTFIGGGEGIHVAIDCMQYGEFDGATWAIVTGTITKGQFQGVDVSGQRAITAVVDNFQGDDYSSLSFFELDDENDCNTFDIFDFPLFRVSAGQVKVW